MIAHVKLDLSPWCCVLWFFLHLIHNILSSNIYYFLRTQWQFLLIACSLVGDFKGVVGWLDGVIAYASKYYFPESGIGRCLNTVIQILTYISPNETVWQFWAKLSSFLLLTSWKICSLSQMRSKELCWGSTLSCPKPRILQNPELLVIHWIKMKGIFST